MRFIAKSLLICAAALSMALAQSTDSAGVTDSDTGSERARLANQRIQADLELRAREEQRRLEEEQARLRAQEAATRSAAAAQPPTPVVTSTPPGPDMSRTLEQIKTLGELKDAGYVSEEEFQRIKQRILDDQL